MPDHLLASLLFVAFSLCGMGAALVVLHAARRLNEAAFQERLSMTEDEHRDAPESLREAIENAGLGLSYRLAVWGTPSNGNHGWMAHIHHRDGNHALVVSDIYPDPESAIRAALAEFKKRKEEPRG